jgi:dTDP-4-amino-4,6-dideoxygalactose transaminase
MRPVFIGASPNTEIDDIKLALKLLFQPWNWREDKGNSVDKFEEMVSVYHGGINAVAMDSARSAFYLLLKAYGVGPGDEVILPSFSCLVIANPVIWVGAKPVYVDIDKETFNLSLNDLKTKVSGKTKVILVQHTFGLPVELEKVREIVGNDVKIVEDIAHSLGGMYKGEKIGTIGDASVATFGIEKVISSVRGGMVLVKDDKIAEKIRSELKSAPHFSLVRIKIALLNPILWSIITPVYYIGFGKATIGRAFSFVAHKLGIMGIMIQKCEYDTQKPSWLPARMPSALAKLGMNQFEKIDRFNSHRREIAKIYEEKFGAFNLDENSKHNYLRYPLLVEPEKRASIYTIASKNHFVLGNWYKNILYAPDSSLAKLGYTIGDTPNAEWVAERIINLPTAGNVSTDGAKQLVRIMGV